MKKKIIIVLMLIIVVAVLVSIILLPKKVEKFSNIKIINSYETEIQNYKENTMPFIIELENEDIKVFINGKKYNKGERIYKCGEYKVTVKQGIKKEQATVKINKVEKTQTNTYKIYVISETLQTLLAGLNISSDINQKGFLWTARTSTISLEDIKTNIPNLQISKNSRSLEIGEFKEVIVPELKQYVEKVLKQDPNAYFKLYMEEDKFYLELELFGKIGLDDSRYDVTMYTDGTLGYVRGFEITNINKYDRFVKEKEDYFNIVNEIKNATKEYNNHPGSYLVDKESSIFRSTINYDYMLISTLRKNIKFMTQYPECITFKDEKIAKEMENANICKIVAHDEFEKLNAEQKEIFFSMINLNKEELDKNYFLDPNNKYLVIIGTVPFYENMNKDEFEKIIKQVAQDYQEEYTILYKPHPRAIPTEEQNEFLSELNIKVLPGKIPMEAIMFIYPNLKLGGFPSSLYMSAERGQTEFFFAEEASQLVAPLDELYDTMFSNAKFYN